MTESMLPMYHPVIPGGKIAPFKGRCCHINGSLPDHEDTACPQDQTCSVYAEWYRAEQFVEAVSPALTDEG